MYKLLKGIRLSVWNTENINIRGNGLTDINFANLSTQVKFFDTMKYYLARLGQLSPTLEEAEIFFFGKTTLEFLNQHGYFLKLWLTLNEKNDIKFLILS